MSIVSCECEGSPEAFARALHPCGPPGDLALNPQAVSFVAALAAAAGEGSLDRRFGFFALPVEHQGLRQPHADEGAAQPGAQRLVALLSRRRPSDRPGFSKSASLRWPTGRKSMSSERRASA
jgi:hypothetical protein